VNINSSFAGPWLLVAVVCAPPVTSIELSVQPAADATGRPTDAGTGESIVIVTVAAPPAPLATPPASVLVTVVEKVAFRASTPLPEWTGTAPPSEGHTAETNGVTVTLSKPTDTGCTPSRNLLRKGVAPELQGWQ
jgi:hypothetical protein